MKKINLAKNIIILTILFMVVYNSYFGWNLHPTSPEERLCDMIASLASKLAIFFYLIPLFSLYESTVKKQEERKVEDREDDDEQYAAPV